MGGEGETDTPTEIDRQRATRERRDWGTGKRSGMGGGTILRGEVGEIGRG